jgi:two-component system, LytTR family, sensor kinase
VHLGTRRILEPVLPYAALIGAWLPFVLLWAVFAAGHQPVGSALVSGAIGVGTAAVLSLGVWRLCKRHPWPRRLGMRFYFLHLGFATMYSAAWLVLHRALESVHSGEPALRQLLASRLAVMQFLTGLGLYGVVAGVSYAVQIQRRLQEEEKLAVAGRLAALRARLNPHFLFNALHTLTALVRDDPRLAERAIERLGNMLRYALREDDAHVVSFAEEWAFTRQYLEFQRVRFEERLDVVTDVDVAALDVELLPFALQTLVENAVRHSIETRPGSSRLVITAAVGDGALTIRVRNDGAEAADGFAPQSDGHHSGLRTLRERLTVVYDGAASLTTHAVEGQFEACLCVPAYATSPLRDR